mgnify:CR=1 FL=1
MPVTLLTTYRSLLAAIWSWIRPLEKCAVLAGSVIAQLYVPRPPRGCTQSFKKRDGEVSDTGLLTGDHSFVAIFGLLIQGLLPTLFLMEVYPTSVSPPKSMPLHVLGIVTMTLTQVYSMLFASG